MRTFALCSLLCGAIVATALGHGVTPARAASADDAASGEIDLDPLRRFLPRDDLFMPVPGGMVAVTEDGNMKGSIEERAQQRHGGFVVGYCLRSSCTRVTQRAGR